MDRKTSTSSAQAGREHAHVEAASTARLAPRAPEPAPLVLRLDLPDGPRSVSLASDSRLVIGRSDAADIHLCSVSVSRRHARIVGGNPPTIEDLGSTNGSSVAGTPLQLGRPVPLEHGVSVTLGDIVGVVRYSSQTAEVPPARPATILRDPRMLDLYEKARVFAQSDCSVLITGETGVGKEVFAARIHELSPRADKPFIRLNCAALPQDMVESELFGFERGAFTGAVTAKPGLFESAHGGTVLLDEVGDLSLATQAKLLRALDSGEVTRLGALRPRRLDVRILAATNRDLHFMVPAGTFRADLYYRLAGAEVRLPPLRERPDDIEPLAACFLHACAPRCAAARLSPGARALLLAHSWPGNVRELKATIERARMLAEGGEVREEHVSFLALPATPTSTMPLGIPALHPSTPPPPQATSAIDFYSERRDREKSEILAALAACDGNQTRAAEMLQMPRRTLVKRLTEYGIRIPRRPRPSPIPG